MAEADDHGSTATTLSLAWGALSVLLFGSVAGLAFVLGRWVLRISVPSGFVFVAPLRAVREIA